MTSLFKPRNSVPGWFLIEWLLPSHIFMPSLFLSIFFWSQPKYYLLREIFHIYCACPSIQFFFMKSCWFILLMAVNTIWCYLTHLYLFPSTMLLPLHLPLLPSASPTSATLESRLSATRPSLVYIRLNTQQGWMRWHIFSPKETSSQHSHLEPFCVTLTCTWK